MQSAGISEIIVIIFNYLSNTLVFKYNLVIKYPRHNKVKR